MICDAVVCLLCFYTIRLKGLRGPSLLLLVANVLGFVFGMERIFLEFFSISIVPQPVVHLLQMMNRWIVTIEEICSIVAVCWLFVLAIRFKRNPRGCPLS